MIDLDFFRKHFDVLKTGIAKKKFACDLDSIKVLDDKRREYVSQLEELRAEQNQANKDVASLDKKSAEFAQRLTKLKLLSAQVKDLEVHVSAINEEWRVVMCAIPNIPHESVPLGRTPEDNQVVGTWGDPKTVSQSAKPHYDIGWFNDYVDFARGVKVTGAGFPFYVGEMARLVRSLVNFFLDEARNNGYTEMLCPHLVNAASAMATGQLPDKEGQMYEIPKDELYMIPTAEVPLTNFFRDEIFEESQLPVYRCGYSLCFRREAGSWGKDVRGLNRLHQFDKIELVKWVHPDSSFEELEKLRQDAERVLQKLEIPYRTLLICTGDIGFSHAKQYDLEVWAGGQKRWLEVSSCSNFTDFQARRAGIHYRPKQGGKAQYVHTLNGSGLGLPRTLVAILENNLQADGSVKLPQCLHAYFGAEKFTIKQ